MHGNMDIKLIFFYLNITLLSFATRYKNARGHKFISSYQTMTLRVLN